MPTRIDPGLNAHPIPAGVVLSTEEWHRLTDPLGMSGHSLEEVFLVLAGRIDASYNVAHVVRELIDAGEPGSAVPPKDLPAAIHRIGQARHAAEHNVRTLAGEIADLTDRLECVLPDVHETIARELAADLYQNREPGNIEAEDIEDVACSALSLALRLLDAYDMRDRDQARPAEAIVREGDPAARRFTVTLDANPGTFVRESPGRVFAHDPAAVTVNLYGSPVTDLHPTVVYLTEHLGTLKGCSGSYDCRRAVIARTLHDAAADVRVATSTSGTPHDDWIRRAAELLADLTPPIPGGDTLATLARLIRDASDHARRVLLIDPATRVTGTPPTG